MMKYVYLGLGIVGEIVATSSLKASAQFTRPLPSLLVIVGYGSAFYFLTLVLEAVPVGVTYAIWSGLGIVLVTAVAAVVYRQVPDWPAVLGMALIIAGVVVINLLSNVSVH